MVKFGLSLRLELLGMVRFGVLVRSPGILKKLLKKRLVFCWNATIDGMMADPQAIGIHAASRRSANGPNAYATKVVCTQ